MGPPQFSIFSANSTFVSLLSEVQKKITLSQASSRNLLKPVMICAQQSDLMELGHGGRGGLYCHQQQQEDADADAAVAAVAVAKEHMFDKVVTPSDVGKLNRLVIPKQHAEKHFPLDASASEKGLLLSFEDRSGKPWSFRYSYWNSSQSYVMTKGWSRFVKDKSLDAGDTVSFARGAGESGKGRLFIDWRRRPETPGPLQPRSPFPVFAAYSNYPVVLFSRMAAPWAGRMLAPAAAQQEGYRYGAAASSSNAHYQAFRSPLPFQLQHAGADNAILGTPMVPVGHTQQQAAAKRVRLFGVNLDLQESDGQQLQQESNSFLSSSPSTDGKERQHSLDLEL